MARRSKVVFCLLLAFLYVVVNICPLRAEALPDVLSGSTTLADNIMTYYALSGSAVANSDWINTLYNSYGSSFGTIEDLAEQGYLVLNNAGVWEPVQQLETMIEEAPAYASLHLNEMFNVSAEEVAQGGGYAAASGASILAGSLGGVASTGAVPLLGSVTAAYWGGIALGTLIAHKVGLYGKNIGTGSKIDLQKDVLDQIPNGGNLYEYTAYNNGEKGYIICPAECMCVGDKDKQSNNIWQVYGISYGSGYKQFRYILPNGNYYISNINTYSYIQGSFTPFIPNKGDLSISQYYNGIKAGTIPIYKKASPDMIGEDGNLTGDYDTSTQKYTVPDMKPQIDPGTQAGKPLSLPDWLAFANAVQNNNNNTAPSGSPDNASLFDNILDLIKNVVPQPGPNPNPNPDPWSPPVVTPVPDPVYPDPVPDQQITENPQESENPQQTENPIDTGKPWRLPDLRNKFPFCIPWDIAKVFTKLNVNSRQAPYISWRFNPPNTPIDYTFNLDLEDFEEVATLLRTLELMAFIVGLAFATRYLIGAN